MKTILIPIRVKKGDGFLDTLESIGLVQLSRNKNGICSYINYIQGVSDLPLKESDTHHI